MLAAERREIGFADERCFEQLVILPARHLDRAERLQMIGDELGVEQREAAGAQPRHQMHQRHLRGVARAVEHALAEERAAEADAVEPAGQLAVLVGLDAVAMADVVELLVERADARVDPGARPAGLRLGAAVEHAVEVAVDRDAEAVRADGAGEPRRDVEGVQRNDAALLRLDPIKRRVLGAFRHREDAAGVGLEQHLGRDLDEGGFAAGHGGSGRGRLPQSSAARGVAPFTGR